MDQVIKTLSVRACEKGLELVCDLDDAPNQLIGDPLRLRQVLVNLVGNAIKFTSKGAVVVSAAVSPQPIAAATPSEAAPPTASACVFDLDNAVKHCFGKYDVFRKMVGCLFREADPLLEQIRTALGNCSAAEMGNAAHRLKGTVCYLGAAPAMDATRRVEQMGNSADLAGAAEAIQQLEEQLAILKQAIAPHRPAAGE